MVDEDKRQQCEPQSNSTVITVISRGQAESKETQWEPSTLPATLKRIIWRGQT